MSEELNQNTEQTEKPAPSEMEQKALEMGWRPREEFDGNEDDFIDAKEFVRRKPLFDKIDHTNRELKNVKKALGSFKQHYSKVEEVAVQKAIAQLKAARKEALSEGDGDRFDAIDEQLQNAQTQLRQIEAVKNQPVVDESEPHPDFVQFTQRNGWYQNDSELTKFADNLGMGLAATGMKPTEVLAEIEKQVRSRFPAKFRNSRKEEAPDVDASRGNSSNKSDKFVLTEEETKIMNTLVRSGALTKEKYIADIKAQRGQK